MSTHQALAPWENEAYRSRYVADLVGRLIGIDVPIGVSAIPKRLVQYWDDPDAIPDDVCKCLSSWAPIETAGFSRLLFNDYTARDFISLHFGSTHLAAFDLCYHPAMRCDYFRLCYILEKGGFYVDVDEKYQQLDCTNLFTDNCLKIQPLCYDSTTESMIDVQVFSGSASTSPDWIYYFNNNPIIAPAGHPVIRLALDRATHLLLSDAPGQGIQSTTGPGNLTACVVQHALATDAIKKDYDFRIIPDWSYISACHWHLEYRRDARNWRFGIPLKSRVSGGKRVKPPHSCKSPRSYAVLVEP